MRDVKSHTRIYSHTWGEWIISKRRLNIYRNEGEEKILYTGVLKKMTSKNRIISTYKK